MIRVTDNIWAEKIPDDANPYILDSANGKEQGLFWKQPGNASPPWIVLPPGQWEFICTSKDATEEQAGMIVECTMPKVRGAKVQIVSYKNYEGEFSSFSGALPSLQSLLKSKGLEGNYALLKKQ